MTTPGYATWARQARNSAAKYYRWARRDQADSWKASRSAREWYRHYRWLEGRTQTHEGEDLAERIASAKELCTLMTREACREAAAAALYRDMARRQAASARRWQEAADEQAARIEEWRTSPERAAWLARPENAMFRDEDDMAAQA
jgi:hypothetical protein